MGAVAADAGSLPCFALTQFPSTAVDLTGVGAYVTIGEAGIGLGKALFELTSLEQFQIGRLEFLGHEHTISYHILTEKIAEGKPDHGTGLS